jgi:preprotein translocase subunit SecB
MATTNGGSEQQPQQQSGLQLSVLGQYIKDFSFENPNAPRSLAPKDSQPGINIQINVGVGQLAPTDFEVSLNADPRELSVGDPISIEMNVSGSGNFDSLTAPALTTAGDWKTYPARRRRCCTSRRFCVPSDAAREALESG